jgi:2-C-methyl-D-erythritol 4-phosphate cytidylyltransferase
MLHPYEEHAHVTIICIHDGQRPIFPIRTAFCEIVASEQHHGGVCAVEEKGMRIEREDKVL